MPPVRWNSAEVREVARDLRELAGKLELHSQPQRDTMLVVAALLAMATRLDGEAT